MYNIFSTWFLDIRISTYCFCYCFCSASHSVIASDSQGLLLWLIVWRLLDLRNPYLYVYVYIKKTDECSKQLPGCNSECMLIIIVDSITTYIHM